MRKLDKIIFGIAMVELLAVIGVLAFCGSGCSTTATKGWAIGGPCPICNYPLIVVDSELESATAAHHNGGEVFTEDCINPDMTHELLVTNYFNVPVSGVVPWKP